MERVWTFHYSLTSGRPGYSGGPHPHLQAGGIYRVDCLSTGRFLQMLMSAFFYITRKVCFDPHLKIGDKKSSQFPLFPSLDPYLTAGFPRHWLMFNQHSPIHIPTFGGLSGRDQVEIIITQIQGSHISMQRSWANESMTCGVFNSIPRIVVGAGRTEMSENNVPVFREFIV